MNEARREPTYVFEGFRLDAKRRVLHGTDGQLIPLTPRLLDTLLYFVERAGQLLTKEQLLEAIWPNVVVEEHNLNKTVSELRRVLGEKPGEHRFFVTKPGHGYRFVADVSLAPTLESAAESPAEVSPTQPGASLRRYWIAAALGACVLAVGTALYGFFGPAQSSPLRMTPFSGEGSGLRTPVWSPDSREIAFATRSVGSEPARLWIRTLAEPAARPIASRPGRIPAIAQWTSGGKIVFWEREGLYSVSPVGGSPELAVELDFPGLGIFPPVRTSTVSPDGSTLAVVRADGIWTATPPTVALEKYEPAPFSVGGYSDGPFLRFSPDGKQLLFVWYATLRGEEAWLLPFPPDPSNPPHRVLEKMPLAGGTAIFSWFPDSRHVAVSTRDGEQQRSLYVADTRSGEFRVLSTGLSAQVDPVVSPDGSKLIFAEANQQHDIVTLDVETAELKELITTGRTEAMPAWGDGGHGLVYVTDRNGAWEIWLHQPPQPDRPLVTAANFDTPTLYFIAPTLSPDGKRVVYDRVYESGNRSRLWMSAVDGGKPELLTDEDVLEFGGSWSPDSNWYAYLTSPRGDGSRSLKKVKTTGQAAPETLLENLPVVAEERFVPLWSRDGKWLLVPNETMWLVSPDDKTQRRNLRIEPSPCAFAADEPLLYCIRHWEPIEEHAFDAIDFAGNVMNTIGSVSRDNMPQPRFTPGLRLSLTPDGSGVTFGVERLSVSFWLMEGLDKVPLP